MNVFRIIKGMNGWNDSVTVGACDDEDDGKFCLVDSDGGGSFRDGNFWYMYNTRK